MGTIVPFEMFMKHAASKPSAAKVYKLLGEKAERCAFLNMSLMEAAKIKGMGRKGLELIAAVQIDLLGK